MIKIVKLLYIIQIYCNFLYQFGYTFDAGPNPVLLCESDNLNTLIECINYVNKNNEKKELPNEDYQIALNEYKSSIDIKSMIVSDIGEDPQLLEVKCEI